MFRSASEGAVLEVKARQDLHSKLCRFGINAMDDCFLGIAPNDLVLIGAPSGVGKTQLCCQIALKNLSDGKRVFFMALEAEEFEIERRIKFQFIATQYYADANRPRLGKHLRYDSWALGEFMQPLAKYEEQATQFMSATFKNLFMHYKGDRFGVEELIESITLNVDRADLFIIDHAHFFDFEDTDENRALKRIAKTCRELSLFGGKPIILVAHLRKRDRHNDELVPGMDEFHGSSDLVKIATKAIVLAPGGTTSDEKFETFFRMPKNRNNGGVSRYVVRVLFNPRTNSYEESYKVGPSICTRKNGFEELAPNLYPEWARKRISANSGDSHPASARPIPPAQFTRRL